MIIRDVKEEVELGIPVVVYSPQTKTIQQSADLLRSILYVHPTEGG